MGEGRTHVIGAGLAGLSAAVQLAATGRRVLVHEAAPQAGGRCRSYFDSELGCRIDNGNHLLLTANRAALAFLDAIGARPTMTGPDEPRFDFCDLATGERWTLAPGQGRLPWWVFDSRRRVPGTRARDYLAITGLRKARDTETVADRLDTSTALFRRLWQPFAVAALNTEIEAASASLLWRTVRESFGAGGAALRPLVPREGLSESFIDPARRFLEAHGAELCCGSRLRRLVRDAEGVRALEFDAEQIALDADDSVILTVPPAVAARLVPELVVPTEFRAIVNLHYRHDTAPELPLFIGLIGGTAEWVFRKKGVLSVTISAADRLLDAAPEALAERVWRDVATAYRLGDAPLPPWRLVKEKRATFAATPAQLRRRPGPATACHNLFLAGDWTAMGLPGTIEGAIRSGLAAAECAIKLLTKAERAPDSRRAVA
jgi:squalene-associated FAD-dependent desaturase